VYNITVVRITSQCSVLPSPYVYQQNPISCCCTQYVSAQMMIASLASNPTRRRRVGLCTWITHKLPSLADRDPAYDAGDTSAQLMQTPESCVGEASVSLYFAAEYKDPSVSMYSSSPVDSFPFSLVGAPLLSSRVPTRVTPVILRMSAAHRGQRRQTSPDVDTVVTRIAMKKEHSTHGSRLASSSSSSQTNSPFSAHQPLAKCTLLEVTMDVNS
jgi:hypothetical protein